MTKKYLLAVLTVSLLMAGQAFAHAHLKTSDPTQNAVVTQAPAQVTLKFSEDLEISMSKLEVKDSTSGDVVSTGKLSDGGQGKSTMQVTLNPLKKMKSKYQVNWKAVSTDTHRTQGSFEFIYDPKE
jgi:methionine-rich copper-binding protein CopC